MSKTTFTSANSIKKCADTGENLNVGYEVFVQNYLDRYQEKLDKLSKERFDPDTAKFLSDLKDMTGYSNGGKEANLL